MVKYHITDKGIPKKCQAKVRPCKYGEHFTTMESAIEYVDYKNEIKARDASIYDYLLNKDDIIAYTDPEFPDYTTFKYAHMGVNFSDENIRRARGLTFNNKTKELITIGFEKFFNHDQLVGDNRYSEEFIKERSSLDLNNIKNIKFSEKMDGSLILVGRDSSNGNIIFSTTGSSNSVQSRMAKDLVKDNKEIENYLKENNDTLAFEFVSPENRVVVKYNKSKLVLLSIINKDTLKRRSEDEIDSIAENKLTEFEQPKRFTFTLDEFKDFIKEKENFEGFVVENEYGNLVKIKTEQYILLHNKFSEVSAYKHLSKNTIRNVVKEYFNETLDDTLAEINQNQLMFASKNVNKIQKEISEIIYNKNKYSKEYNKLNGDPNQNKIWMMRQDIESFYKSLVIHEKNRNREHLERAITKRLIHKFKYEDIEE